MNNMSLKGQLDRLKRAIRLRKKFNLLIAVFNSDINRDKLIEDINAAVNDSVVVEITNHKFVEFGDFERYIASLSKKYSVIHVVNKGEQFYKDTWDEFYKGLNYHREKIKKENPAAVILWMREQDIKDFALLAPDMWSWRAGVFQFDLMEQDFLTGFALQDTAKENKEKKERERIDEIINYLDDNPGLESSPRTSLLHELGELYYKLGDYKKAQDYILKSLDFYVKRGNEQKSDSLYRLLKSIEKVSSEEERNSRENTKDSAAPAKILVVDDDIDWKRLLKHKYRKQIGRKEWEFIFARDGMEALEISRSHPGIRLILLDLKMPGMGGFEFLDALNKMDNPAVKTIVITSYGDLENTRNAMNRGAFDFLTKPIDYKDLELTILKALKHIDLINSALKAREELATFQRELETAARIQRFILPTEFPPFPGRTEFDIYANIFPSKKVGGTFYDFYFIDSYRLAFSVGDIGGTGIPAALYMSKFITLLKAISMQVGNPGKCLSKLNNLLAREKPDDIPLIHTIFHAVINVETGVIEFSCAGNPAPYLIQADGKLRQIPQKRGLPLGVFMNHNYIVENIRLKKSETIFVFTDGLLEIKNPEGNHFGEGERRLEEYLEHTNERALKELVNGLIMELRTFARGIPQADDIAVLALRYN